MRMKITELFGLQSIKNILLTVIGTMILALGASLFIIPFELVVGGISSLGIIINKIVPILSVDSIITILAWSLFILGFFTLGKNFALKTLISTIIYPLFISIFSKIGNSGIFNDFFNIKTSVHGDVSVILAALFGGLLVGLGCAITFLGGGSTGGIDIIAFLIAKHLKKVKTSKIIFLIDSAVIVLGVFIINDLIITLLGITAAFISATVIDKVFIGRSKALIAQIISENYQEINNEIIHTLNRTATQIKVTGGYTKSEKVMLIVSFSIRQYADLLAIVNKCDQNAFLIIQQASEINGKGWTK